MIFLTWDISAGLHVNGPGRTFSACAGLLWSEPQSQAELQAKAEAMEELRPIARTRSFGKKRRLPTLPGKNLGLCCNQWVASRFQLFLGEGSDSNKLNQHPPFFRLFWARVPIPLSSTNQKQVPFFSMEADRGFPEGKSSFKSLLSAWLLHISPSVSIDTFLRRFSCDRCLTPEACPRDSSEPEPGQDCGTGGEDGAGGRGG